MKNTTENNKLIAEFMGAKPNRGGEYELYGIIEAIEDGEHEQHFFFGSEMKFSTDWNWLMPVVEKIEGLEDNNNLDDCFKQSNKVCGLPIYAKIETVYTAVIEFIKWHNLNK